MDNIEKQAFIQKLKYGIDILHLDDLLEIKEFVLQKEAELTSEKTT